MLKRFPKIDELLSGTFYFISLLEKKYFDELLDIVDGEKHINCMYILYVILYD